MKRILSIVLALVMALSLVACGSKNDDAKDPAADGEKQTVDFPTRDITMIVPFGAGGATDLICRTLAAEMEKASTPKSITRIKGIGTNEIT